MNDVHDIHAIFQLPYFYVSLFHVIMWRMPCVDVNGTTLRVHCRPGLEERGFKD